MLKTLAFLFILSMACLVASYAGYAIVTGSLKGPTQTQYVDREWSMPARFNGNGAITFGCGIWDTPLLHAYGDDNPDTGSSYLALSGENNDYTVLFAVDGPQGTVVEGGRGCGFSIDWRAFPPLMSRPTGDDPHITPPNVGSGGQELHQ